MRTMITVFVGSLTVIGFWFFESAIFGLLMWLVLNFGILLPLNSYLTTLNVTLIPVIPYIFCVSILVMIRLLRFDATQFKGNMEEIEQEEESQ